MELGNSNGGSAGWTTNCGVMKRALPWLASSQTHAALNLPPEPFWNPTGLLLCCPLHSSHIRLLLLVCVLACLDA